MGHEDSPLGEVLLFNSLVPNLQVTSSQAHLSLLLLLPQSNFSPTARMYCMSIQDTVIKWNYPSFSKIA